MDGDDGLSPHDHSGNGNGESPLAISSSRLRESFDFSPNARVITDAQGVILGSNQASALLLKCPKEFLPGKPLGLFVAIGARARFYESLYHLGRGIATDSFECRLGRKHEPPRDVLVVGTLWGGGPGPRGFEIEWTIRDVTEIRTAGVSRLALLRRLVTAQEDERRRVARELHDSLGQLLVALRLAVKSARKLPGETPAGDSHLADVEELTDQLSVAVRELTTRLRPTILDDIGLDATLRQHVAAWSALSGVEVDYQSVGIDVSRLPPDVETAVYRLVQEALTNVARHGRARLVSVVVTRRASDGMVIVEDDGAGFDPQVVPKRRGHLGLISMRERMELIGGTLEIESAPGHGTTLIARFPVPSPPELTQTKEPP